VSSAQALTAWRTVSATTAGSESITTCEAPSTTVTVAPIRSYEKRCRSGWIAPSAVGRTAHDGLLRQAGVPPRERHAICCQSRLTHMNAEDIASAITSNDPSPGLRAALALHRLAERVEADHVATARQQGWSWQQIGDALGVTRQSVHAKYGKRLP